MTRISSISEAPSNPQANRGQAHLHTLLVELIELLTSRHDQKHPACQVLSWTPAQLARALQVSRSKILGWIKSGELVATDVGISGRPRFIVMADNLAEFLRGRETAKQALQRCRRVRKSRRYVPQALRRWVTESEGESPKTRKASESMAQRPKRRNCFASRPLREGKREKAGRILP